jgi:hypothetical protein
MNSRFDRRHSGPVRDEPPSRDRLREARRATARAKCWLFTLAALGMTAYLAIVASGASIALL